MKYFSKCLRDSAPSLIYSGTWMIAPITESLPISPYSQVPSGGLYTIKVLPRPNNIEQVFDYPDIYYDTWNEIGDVTGGIIRLRMKSEQSEGRVKMWRKHAISESLSPILVLFIPIFEKYIIIDGHDRLLACLLENKPVPIIALWYVREYVDMPDKEKQDSLIERLEEVYLNNPKSVESINSSLIYAYGGKSGHNAITAGWPINGGLKKWQEEVKSRLKNVIITDPVDADILLQGWGY